MHMFCFYAATARNRWTRALGPCVLCILAVPDDKHSLGVARLRSLRRWGNPMSTDINHINPSTLLGRSNSSSRRVCFPSLHVAIAKPLTRLMHRLFLLLGRLTVLFKGLHSCSQLVHLARGVVHLLKRHVFGYCQKVND